MDKPYLRHQILKHKTLLRNLQKQANVQKTLNHSDNEGLNFVLKLLHFITNGRISLPSSAHDAIGKSLRSKKLAAFESRKYLYRLLQSSREEKLSALRQFNKLYPVLFHYIFHLEQ